MLSQPLLWIVGVMLLAAGAAFAQTSASTDEADDRKLEDTPKLTVRGEAELEKPADQVVINVGVVTENRDAGEALQENTDLMNAVVEAIEKAGLGEGEYETGRFRIRPEYSRRPRRPESDWKPQIIGYEVTNSVVITTKQIDLAGELIQSANRAGANTVEVAGFSLSDARKYREEAIRKATRHAMADATALADAASLKLVRILSINLDHTPVRGPEKMYRGMQAAADAGGGPPPITAGDVTVRASVNIVYEIAPANGDD